MPSVTPFELPMPSPSKKRRRDDDSGEVKVSMYGSSKPSTTPIFTNSDIGSRTTQYNESPNLLSTINNNERLIPPSSSRGAVSLLNMPRKAIPLPVNKKVRLVNENDETHIHSHHNGSPAGHSPQQSHFSHAHPEYSTPPASPHHSRSGTNTVTNPSAPLSPCHICHRKPTKKSELDSFADCMGCGQRACFVCVRACQGWLPPSDEEENLSASFIMQDVDDNGLEPISDTEESSRKQRKGEGPKGGWIGRGHRKMVCSRCCVERGVEGDVVCLGCLAGMEGA
ncbi:hypothetical protein F4677DRAFT_19580 [Hypoxylon crocopeplum]|nr:hypothetical protein F4677DRAFT_19580 [Hypoxylon crocopeplum]